MHSLCIFLQLQHCGSLSLFCIAIFLDWRQKDLTIKYIMADSFPYFALLCPQNTFIKTGADFTELGSRWTPIVCASLQSMILLRKLN